VEDNSFMGYEMPSFKEPYKNFNYSSLNIFEHLVKKQGHDVEKMWAKIDNAIATIVRNTEGYVIKRTKEMNFSSNYLFQNSFELVRFDIILDAELNPFVVEVNMSPVLTPSSEMYEENSWIYRQVIYNVMKMIGGASYHEFWSR
jgi:tubulin monoglycylase TTLL15